MPRISGKEGIFGSCFALLPKLDVEGSTPFSRSL